VIPDESLPDESFTSPTFSPFRDCSKRVEFVVLGIGEGYSRPFGDLSGTFFFQRRRSRLLKTRFFRQVREQKIERENSSSALRPF